jgi:hypothetical protein
MERIHLQEQQYLAGEREAGIAELRNDPEYNQDQDDQAVVEKVAAQRLAAAPSMSDGISSAVIEEINNETANLEAQRDREEEAWSLAADMLDAQYSE